MDFAQTIFVDGKEISSRSKTYIIAEAGVNHGGCCDIAKKLIDVACDAGADAVKFQSFQADNLLVKGVAKAPYQADNTNNFESQYDMIRSLELSVDQCLDLQIYCNQKGITFLTTPFDEFSLEALDKLDLPAYKVSSTDLTNIPFLKLIARKNKPVFLSTGMSYLSEIDKALFEINRLNSEVVVLQCTSDYPIKDSEANLTVLNLYRRRFGALVGFSDHSIGIGAAPYAVSLGAKVVEKHFTLDKSMDGPDHKASLSPDELVMLVKDIRKSEMFLGNGAKTVTEAEVSTRRVLQKFFVARKAIKKGELFKETNIVGKRTGGKGISPYHFDRVFGLVANRNYDANEVIDVPICTD